MSAAWRRIDRGWARLQLACIVVAGVAAAVAGAAAIAAWVLS